MERQQEEAVARIQDLRSHARDERPFDFNDPKLLSKVLLGLLERLPDDLSLGAWESPTTTDHNVATEEVMDLTGIAYRAAQVHGLAQ